MNKQIFEETGTLFPYNNGTLATWSNGHTSQALELQSGKYLWVKSNRANKKEVTEIDADVAREELQNQSGDHNGRYYAEVPDSNVREVWESHFSGDIQALSGIIDKSINASGNGIHDLHWIVALKTRYDVNGDWAVEMVNLISEDPIRAREAIRSKYGM